ncbi:MAG TPA: UDP-N-acetylmuramoyl-L-alanyl-D-glutamate--2,6-diaminopimelate ligase [Candidatus Baltobacteraceae bacterium]|nr:UDP-N-acetylmuramoyl-L-alanyl-D-glutamate--2,6-diaminopimelate ligase [Candidatus Baltobacteraceae bacterium]
MTLDRIVARLPASTQVIGERSREISSIEIDSRRVTPGALFVAMPGEHTDGHAFVQRAIAAGAVAVVVEAAHALAVPVSVSAIHVPDTRRALSTIAAAFFDDPSRALDVLGVTGTNGKTTTTRMIAAILEASGRPCGVIGTVGAQFREHNWTLENTTPLPPELHGLLAQMRELGAWAVAMEVSSHALALDRVEDVRFKVAALTNITRDHLDFHQTLEAYAAAKRRLFTMAAAAVLNVDDEYGARWLPDVRRRIPTLSYSLHGNADITARTIEPSASGSTFDVDGVPMRVHLPGMFNVANALAAIGVARSLDLDLETCAHGLDALERVPGRMEHVNGGDIDVVVDYSHTPDSLENALIALRETAPRALAVVFGCGGDRDRGKRPQMGRVAAAYADRIYVTSDNPRSESPEAIVAEIETGIGAHPHVSQVDRRAAIHRAIEEAGPGDVVLIAGKGHETYQIIGTQTLPFDDVEVAREALAARGAHA